MDDERKDVFFMNRNRKLSRVKKSVVSGLVVTSLVLGNSTFIQAEQVTKEESVYVNAEADGAVTGITVSDWLKHAGVNGTISDKSTLKDIQNVKLLLHQQIDIPIDLLFRDHYLLYVDNFVE